MPSPSRRSRRLLPRSFYARPAEAVARDLLGKYLVRRHAAGRIVEVEAYVGPEDLACHAAKGLTPRTRVMFGPPGHAYVFLVYGMHHCFNVVCERRGFPAAVLVRAVEPAEGVELPTDGPGRLSKALGITLADNTLDLRGDTVWLEDRGGAEVTAAVTPRIGVEYAGAWAAAPLRFLDPESRWVSKRLAPRSR